MLYILCNFRETHVITLTKFSNNMGIEFFRKVCHIQQHIQSANLLITKTHYRI